MDIPTEMKVKTINKTNDIKKDIPTEVQDVSDSVCSNDDNIEIMSTTSSDSDSSSPIKFFIESIKTAHCKSNAIRFGYDNANETNLPTEVEKVKAKLNGFKGYVNGATFPLAPSMNRSPSVQGHYSSIGSTTSDLELLDDPKLFTNDDAIIGPNVDSVITKQYSPSLNRISDELHRLRESPVNDSPWEFLQSNVSFTTAAGRRSSSYVPRNRAHHSTYSVGIQVNNPEIGYFIHRNTHIDWIRCMICSVIVACIITGLCAATVMILNTFFQYWLLP